MFSMQTYADKYCIETTIELSAHKKELFSKINSIKNLLMLLATLLWHHIFEISGEFCGNFTDFFGVTKV